MTEKTPFIDHVPPKEFPLTSLVGVNVPMDFNKVIIAAAAKNGILYADQLLAWAQKGVECERLNHEAKLTGRTKRK